MIIRFFFLSIVLTALLFPGNCAYAACSLATTSKGTAPSTRVDQDITATVADLLLLKKEEIDYLAAHTDVQNGLFQFSKPLKGLLHAFASNDAWNFIAVSFVRTNEIAAKDRDLKNDIMIANAFESAAILGNDETLLFLNERAAFAKQIKHGKDIDKHTNKTIRQYRHPRVISKAEDRFDHDRSIFLLLFNMILII